MIYTLDYIEKEANAIASCWNGKTETFYHEDTKYDESAVQACEELLAKVKEVKELISELSI